MCDNNLINLFWLLIYFGQKTLFCGTIINDSGKLVLAFNSWEMLTSALKALIKNPVKESFYRKRKNSN